MLRLQDDRNGTDPLNGDYTLYLRSSASRDPTRLPDHETRARAPREHPMEDPTEIYDTGELVAHWHAIVEAYVAEELAESVRRLTELSSARDERAWPDPIAIARHLAHALIEATVAHGVRSAVEYLQQVAGVSVGEAGPSSGPGHECAPMVAS